MKISEINLNCYQGQWVDPNHVSRINSFIHVFPSYVSSNWPFTFFSVTPLARKQSHLHLRFYFRLLRRNFFFPEEITNPAPNQLNRCIVVWPHDPWLQSLLISELPVERGERWAKFMAVWLVQERSPGCRHVVFFLRRDSQSTFLKMGHKYMWFGFGGNVLFKSKVIRGYIV